ncbi:Ribosomal protein S18 acetylase RimI [Solimonas aquatica]|uniref:Ribosomal protein S18 acetylase RimI n=1 Tax=Solimonas aquatica TaxID=489703 RepID=A0A1H9I498_9GAMM|nr:GNAT family N-acetyltransferase [Solimonas aquatica]SEQ69358.1 Ribosomal protein S18 acetylase RimI [Solimonas aquatica]
MSAVTIRAARPDDVPLLVQLVQALADYENLREQCVLREEDLREHLFGARPYAEALIAEYEGEAAGFALFFHNYSTFAGRPGIYLEDLFVKPAMRRHGLGRRLLQALAALAVQRGCARFEWTVLDWNEPAIRFYESLGAELKREWLINRVSGEALRRLAEGLG